MTNLGGEGHVVMLSEPGFFFFMFRLIEKKIEKSVVSLKKLAHNVTIMLP